MQQLLILITVLLSSSQATSVSPTGSDNQLMCLQSLFQCLYNTVYCTDYICIVYCICIEKEKTY